MKKHPKPKYKVGDCVVGRTDHLGDNFPNEIVMIEVESARYEWRNGHWIYCGYVQHIGKPDTRVEIYEWDIERKL